MQKGILQPHWVKEAPENILVTRKHTIEPTKTPNKTLDNTIEPLNPIYLNLLISVMKTADPPSQILPLLRYFFYSTGLHALKKRLYTNLNQGSFCF